MFELDGVIFDEVVSAIAEDTSTGKLLYRLPQISDCTIDVTAESVDAVDKAGNLIKRTYRAKNVAVSMTNAHLDLNAYASMAGTEKEIASEENKLPVPKTIRVDASKRSVVLNDVPIDGSLAVSSLQNTGSIKDSYDLSTEFSNTTFSYDSSTNTINFPRPARVAQGVAYFYEDEASVSGTTLSIALSSEDAYIQSTTLYLSQPNYDLEDLEEISKWLVKYDYEADSAVRVVQDSIHFPRTIKLIINAFGYDTCNVSELRYFRITFPRFQPSPECTISMTTDATFDFTGDAQTTYCDDEHILYEITAADEDTKAALDGSDADGNIWHSVKFYNDNQFIETVNNVNYGATATFIGEVPVSKEYPDAAFTGWNPDPVCVVENMKCYATYAVPYTEIADDWDTIIRRITNGTACYAIGQYKPIDLGEEGIINMQIVGENVDALSDDSGTARYTFVAKELLKTKYYMNIWDSVQSSTSEDTVYEDQTGSIGGWRLCAMRSYLKDFILPLIPVSIRSAIKTVKKTQSSRDTSGTSFTQTSDENIWIPSKNELKKTYANVFTDEDARIKHIVDSEDAEWWWLRNAGGCSNFGGVSETGEFKNATSSMEKGICICFCI